MTLAITGKTAVVTGAANGVGLAIARHFVERGANVMFADIDEARLEAELGDVEDEKGTARYFAGDLREKLTRANLLSATIDAFERVDVLVNASRQVDVSDPLDPETDNVEALLATNLMISLRMSQLFAKRMIEQTEAEGDEDDERPAGSIINLSSIAARRTMPEMLAYSVSSAALDQLTRSMAVTLAPHRIRVNAIALGSVMSASLQGALRDEDVHRKTIVDHTPLGRIAGAGELAEVAQFLASDGSGFMTGQVLTVDGGRTLLDAVDAPVH
ncbi:MAG: SDR family oxidoreductase [Paracoccaceae bacterium]|nr:SDR family oxidoreductase [Paracoccaceae bacterium]